MPNSMATRSIDNTQNTSSKKIRFSLNLKLTLLLGLISFIVYANTLKNGFVLDDNDVIKSNAFVTKGIPAIPEILSTPYRRGFSINSNDLYRPLSLVMFAAEYEFFELNSVPYHLINILLFAGCVILLFRFLDKLFEQKKTAVAFIASLLFALHPIHTEVVANIKSRDELLCFFFAFLCLNVFIKYIQSGKIIQLLVGSFCFFLSLISKETGITFLAIIPIVFFLYINEQRKRSIYITSGIVLAAVIFLAIRLSVLNSYNAGNVSDINFIDNALAKPGLAIESRIATAVLIMGFYIKLLFVPYPLICDYSYNSIPLVHFNDPLVLISLAVYLFLAFFSIRSLIKNHKDPFAFAILFFLVTISIFTNIPFLIGSAMGERFLFFGSVGYCLALPLIIEKFVGTKTGFAILKQPKVLGVIIIISIVYCVITIARNDDWLDNYTLCKADIQKAPNNSRLHYYMGYELENTVVKNENDPAIQQHIRGEAINYFKQAIEIYPDFADARANLGYVYFNMSLYDSAEFYDKSALKFKPDFLDVINNLAKVYFVTKKYQQAIELFRKAIDANPNNAELYTNISACFGSLGRYDSAIAYANKGLLINPGFNVLYENIAFTYKLMGNRDSARKYEAIAQIKNPGFRL